METVFEIPPFPRERVTGEITINTVDDETLHGWQVGAQENPRGNLIILHGIKDYSERYIEFAQRLSRLGYQVFSYDLRGHGRSSGSKTYFAHFDDLISDLNLAIKKFKEYDNKKPWFILGHSTGGSIAARYATDNTEKINGFILSAPLLKRRPEFSNLQVGGLQLLNIIAPHWHIINLPNKNFSRDSNVVRMMKRDPLIDNDKVPARTSVEILNNIEYIEENREEIKDPVLILHGTGDKINNIEGSKDFFRSIGVTNKELKIYPRLGNDLFHEPEHKQVEDDIIDWLNAMTMKH